SVGSGANTVGEDAAIGDGKGRHARSYPGFHALRDRERLARQRQRRWIERLRKERTLPHEQQVAALRIEDGGAVGTSEALRFRRSVVRADVDAGDLVRCS